MACGSRLDDGRRRFGGCLFAEKIDPHRVHAHAAPGGLGNQKTAGGEEWTEPAVDQTARPAGGGYSATRLSPLTAPRRQRRKAREDPRRRPDRQRRGKTP